MNTIRIASECGYHCFDRILLNGLIQPFQQPERVIGFFNAYREGKRVIRNCLRDTVEQFSELGKEPPLEVPQGRRDDFVIRTLSTTINRYGTTGINTRCGNTDCPGSRNSQGPALPDREPLDLI
jgi:hypothetical protein